MDRQELRDAVEKLEWFHRIDLGNGIVTPGKTRIDEFNSARMGIPQRLDGKRVLDIGAWDGGWSIEAARRGASEVVAADHFAWHHVTSQEAFLLARAATGFEQLIRPVDVAVEDLDPEAVGGTADVVFFMGVLYHLRDPITGLERAASCCDGLLIVETETCFDWMRRPVGRLYPGLELDWDDTNWWALNVAAIKGLLQRFGFSRVERYSKVSPLRRFRRANPRAWRPSRHRSFMTSIQNQRSVFHAYR